MINQPFRILSAEDVRRVLSMGQAIGLMKNAFVQIGGERGSRFAAASQVLIHAKDLNLGTEIPLLASR